MGYTQDRQLLDAGKAEEKADVLEKAESDRQKAKDVKAGIDTLPTANVIKLREKYTRD